MNGWLMAAVTFVLIVAMGLGFVLFVQRSMNQVFTRTRKPPTVWRSAWFAAQLGFLLSVGAVVGWGRYLLFARANGEVRWLGVLWYEVGPSRMQFAEGAIGFVIFCTIVTGIFWGLRSWRSQQA